MAIYSFAIRFTWLFCDIFRGAVMYNDLFEMQSTYIQAHLWLLKLICREERQ